MDEHWPSWAVCDSVKFFEPGSAMKITDRVRLGATVARAARAYCERGCTLVYDRVYAHHKVARTARLEAVYAQGLLMRFPSGAHEFISAVDLWAGHIQITGSGLGDAVAVALSRVALWTAAAS